MKNIAPEVKKQARLRLAISTAALLIFSSFSFYSMAAAAGSLELVNTSFTGNTNGVFNPGSNFGLTTTINAINQNAINASATLTSSDACVTINQASGSFGNMTASQNSSNSSSPFQFSISSSCPNGHLIKLMLTLAASGYTSSPIMVPVIVAIPSATVIPAPYTCTSNYYVSTNGNDYSNNGTSIGQAWQTINHALSSIQRLGNYEGGLCLNVEPGVYNESHWTYGLGGSSNTPTGFLVMRSTMLHGATIQVPVADASQWYGNCFRFDAGNYIAIDGFNLAGQNTIPLSSDSGIVTVGIGATASHFTIINNLIYSHGAAGIGVNHFDYLIAEGNSVFNNANTSPYEVSGISSWQAVASDSASGFHNIISDNVVFNNAEINDGQTIHSDGNGIIFDDSRNTQDNSTYGPYAQQTLIENNLVFGNGGSGIHVFISDNVTVRNNTVYGNEQDPIGLGTWRGDINAINGANNKFVNNIAVAVQAANKWNASNVSLLDNSTNGSNINNLWYNNLTFNGTTGQTSTMVSGSPTMITTANGNILGQNPKFVNSTLNNFTLQPGSPAILAGTNVYGYYPKDIAGNARSADTIDLGAYQYSNSTTFPLTVTNAGSGFGMIFGSTTTSSSLINCGVNTGATICNSSLNSGIAVNLTAVPASGSIFSGWTVCGSPAGTCTGTTSPCVITVTAATNVTANFTPQTFALTISSGNGGSINPSGAVSVNYGANQTFTVTPNTGYTAQLTVDGAVVALTNGQYTSMNVTASHTITAHFSVQSLPVINITNPINGTSLTIGSNVTITATASETNGTISKVAFYNGSVLLGITTKSPYTYTWSNVAAGNYNLTAVATDANGVSVTSSPVTISAGEIINNIDPNKVILTGAWTSSTVSGGYYGPNYIHDGNTLKGTKSVQFTPNLLGGARSYQVYIRYTSYYNRATNVPVDIIHSGITTTITLNQQINGGVWVYLGTYNFLANRSGEGVTIRTTSTNGYVIANAVEFI